MLKGNKPDFHNAMAAEASEPMYDDFLRLLGSKYKPEAVKGNVTYMLCTELLLMLCVCVCVCVCVSV